MFSYVNRLDAVGTLYQDATVRWYDLHREGKAEEAKKFGDAAEALKAAWPELVAQSLGKGNTDAPAMRRPSKEG